LWRQGTNKKKFFTSDGTCGNISLMLTKEKAHDIVGKFGATPRDTGNTAVQIALLTERINGLSGHFQNAPKDHGSRRGLLLMVGQRRRLLAHLRSSEPKRYVELLKELKLRK
jgi:small subunit ribosomal protein S15